MANFYHIDNYYILLTQGGTHGIRDGLGRTVRLAIAFDDPRKLKGTHLCWVYVPGEINPHIQFWRHPIFIDSEELNDFSRDHYTYYLIGLKYFGLSPTIKTIVEETKWKLSDKYSQTIDLWLWSKALYGNKLATSAFYTIAIPTLLLSSLNNWIWHKIGRFSEEMDQETYDKLHPLKTTKRQKWILGDKEVRKGTSLFYPTYALVLLALQVYVMEKSIFQKIAKIFARPMVGKNPLLKILTGMKISKSEVEEYKPMRGTRLTTKLNERNNRWCQLLNLDNWEDSWYLDKKLIETLYYKSIN